MPSIHFLIGSSVCGLRALASRGIAFDCAITSPAYWSLRDYGCADQDGLEPTPHEYIRRQLEAFGLLKPLIKKSGSIWVVLDDTYSSGRGKPVGPDRKQSARRFSDGVRPADRAPSITGVPKKSLSLVPEMFMIGMVYELGLVARARIAWRKPNALPEPTAFDRPQRTTESLLHFVHPVRNYFFDKTVLAARGLDSTVWDVPTKPFGKHRAVFPEELVEPMLLATCPEEGWVIDHNAGSGTVGLVAHRNNRNSYLIEINPDYVMGVAVPRLLKAGIPADDIMVETLTETDTKPAAGD